MEELSIADQLSSELGSINKIYDKKKKKKEDFEARKVMSPYNASKEKKKEEKVRELKITLCALHDPHGDAVPPASHLVPLRLVGLGLKKVQVNENARSSSLKHIIYKLV